MKGDEMKPQPKGPCYKIQLWRSQRVKGGEEELVIAKFYPAMVDGFAVPLTSIPKTNKEAKMIRQFKSLGIRAQLRIIAILKHKLKMKGVK
jgi:hypothetical protein